MIELFDVFIILIYVLILCFLIYIQIRIMYVLEYRTTIFIKNKEKYNKLPSMLKMIFQLKQWNW